MSYKHWLAVLVIVSAGVGPWSDVLAETWTPGGVTPGQWMFGGRVGPTTLTQSLSSNTDTSTGSALNFQGMYALTNWAMVGLMPVSYTHLTLPTIYSV